MLGRIGVEGAQLVGILAIAQVRLLLHHQRQAAGEQRARLLVQVAGDVRVVCGGERECLRGQLLAGLGAHAPMALRSRRTDAYWVWSLTAATPGKFLAAARSSATPPMSICSRAWSRVVSALRTVLGEGVEVDDHDVELLDPVLGQLGQMIRLVASGEQAGEDRGMEGLDPAAQDLRRVGQVRDGADLDLVLRQVSSGAVGGEALDPGLAESSGQLNDAFAVRDGEECAQGGDLEAGGLAWTVEARCRCGPASAPQYSGAAPDGLPWCGQVAGRQEGVYGPEFCPVSCLWG